MTFGENMELLARRFGTLKTPTIYARIRRGLTISWVIVGGESGPNYRPMDHDWARHIRDQCLDAKVAFFYKQSSGIRTEMDPYLDGVKWEQYPE